MRSRVLTLAIDLFWVTLLGVTAAVAQTLTTEPSSDAFQPAARSCIEQMISVFENESTSLKYDIVEDLNDGRGYTAGRAGFASRDSDLLEVVEVYNRLQPNNALSVFVPVLKQRRGTASTEGLEAFPAAWKKAASDPLFRQAQDQVNDELYYRPAMQAADALHLRSPLAKLALYDALIQHGIGEHSDGFNGIIRSANRAAQGPPYQVGEQKWLMAFLIARKQVLLNASEPETRQVWRESVGRVNEQLRLLRVGNLQLSPPVVLNPYGTAFTVNCVVPLSAPKKTELQSKP